MALARNRCLFLFILMSTTSLVAIVFVWAPEVANNRLKVVIPLKSPSTTSNNVVVKTKTSTKVISSATTTTRTTDTLSPTTTHSKSTRLYLENLQKLHMNDPRLINYIKSILEPSSQLPYFLLNPNRSDYSQTGQSDLVAEFFKHKRNGTFLEAGAFDGETLSNSLYFEKTLGWRGILVDPILKNQQALRQRHRKSHFLPGCLAGKYPIRIKFKCFRGDGSICTYSENVNNTKDTDSPLGSWCFPLYSILLAANMTQIDYLSLDLEGFEMDVLSAVPFDQVQIKLIQIEAVTPGEHRLNPQRLETFRNFFKTNWPQYEELNSTSFPIDIVFINKQLP